MELRTVERFSRETGAFHSGDPSAFLRNGAVASLFQGQEGILAVCAVLPALAVCRLKISFARR